MTENEAERIVMRLAAAWPHVALAAPTIALWVGKLTPLNVRASIQAMEHLEDTSRYLPTWAEFREAYDHANRPRPVFRDALPPGPPQSADPQIAKRAIDDMRVTIAKARGPFAKSIAQAVAPATESLRDRLKHLPSQSAHMPTYADVYPEPESAPWPEDPA